MERARFQMRSAQRKSLAVAAIAGALLLFVGSYLHPMDADPNNAPAAFAEYARCGDWIGIHLIQLAGFALMFAVVIILADRICAHARSATMAALARAGAITGLALAAALQVVDGVALKLMVDRWAAALAEEKVAAFYAALAVRSIEMGLAAAVSLVSGATLVLLGTVMNNGARLLNALQFLAIMAGALLLVAGVVIAKTGFSDLAMAIDMPASAIVMLWMTALGIALWRDAIELT